MSYYKEYKKIQEQRRKAAGEEPEKKESYYRQYKAIQEARARDLASKTAENLKSMNGTTKLMSMQESFGNTMTGTYAAPVKRHVVNSTLRAMNYANKKDEDKIMSDIETSFAKREDRDNILAQVNNPVNTNKRNRNTIMSNNRASEEFVSQFENKSAYDNAINMVRYGDKNYDELMAISKANADKKAAGMKINEDEDKWIREYADRVKTSADVEKERAQLREEINTQDEKIQENIQARWQQKEDVNPFDKHKKNAADMFNNPTPEVAAKNHMKEKESLKKALEKLDKEYENRKQREYYESLPGMDDFEEVAAIGRARKDNYANETDKDLDWRDYNYWTQLYRMEQRVYEPAKGDYMSDEEKNIYSYILEKEGNKKANEYLDYLTEDLNYRMAQKDYEKVENNTALEILSGIKTGYGNIRDGMAALTNNIAGDKALPTSKNEYLDSMIRDDLDKEGLWAKVLYDVGRSGTEMLPSMAIGAMTGGAGTVASAIGKGAAAASFGVNAGARSANQAWRDGAAYEDAMAYGIANGILETGGQYLLGGVSSMGGTLTGITKNVVTSKVKSTLGKAILNTGFSMVGEGAEEYFQEIIDPVVRNMTLGENNEFKFISEEALYAGLVGAITGGMLGGAENISSARTESAYQHIGSEIAPENIEQLAEYAETVDALSDVAEQYRNNPTEVNAGILKVETDRHIGKLANESVKSGENNAELEALDGYVGEIAKEAMAETRSIISQTDESVLSKTIDTFSDSAKDIMNSTVPAAVVDEVTYKNAFANYYSYGRAGMKFETAEQNATFKDELTDAQKRLAYETGKHDRDIFATEAQENVGTKTNSATGMLRYITESELGEGMKVPAKVRDLNERQKSSIMALRTYAEVSGQDIILYESSAVDGKITTPNGWYNKSNNAIYVDVNSGDIGEFAMLRTASHEITHSIKEWSPEKYKVLQDYVIEQFENDGSIEMMVQEEIRLAKNNGQTLTYDEAMDEVTANACEMMLKDTKAIERIANEEPDLFRRIKIIINKIIDNIKQAFDGLRSGSMEHKQMSKLLDDWTEIQNMWDDALVDSAKKSREAGKRDSGTSESDENVYSNRRFEDIKFMADEIAYIDKKEFARRSIANNSKYKKVRAQVKEMLVELSKKFEYITVNDTNEKIYLDNIFADEYANSDDSLLGDNVRKNAKMNATSQVENIIRNAKYYNHRKSIKNKKIDDKNGYDYYKIMFALKKEEDYNYYKGTLVVRKDSFGKSFAYDIIKISADYDSQHPKSGSQPLSVDKSNVTPNNNNVNTSHSFRDNTGKELTSEQAEFFKDSKVRDENGNLLTMYHGTPYGGFTVFKNDLNYFTPIKEYADRYHSPSASSIRGTYEPATEEKTYQVYLNIKKPFDISDKDTRDIYVNEYIKGGYAAGINPYMSQQEIDNIIKDGIDWVEADNIKEFIEENEYDYDGIVLNEGGDLLSDGSVYNRGNSYVTFYPEQVKDVDNTSPTENEDIRYSNRDISESYKEKSYHEKAMKRAIKMKPVAVIRDNVLMDKTKSVSQQVNEYYDAIGNAASNRLLGKIALDNNSIKDDIAHGIGREKVIAFMGVKDVIEKGEIIDYQYKWKDRGYDTAVLVAPIKISDSDGHNTFYDEFVIVRVNKNKNRAYVHEVISIKKEEVLFKTWDPGKNTSVTPSNTSSDILTLIHKYVSVKYNEGIMKVSVDTILNDMNKKGYGMTVKDIRNDIGDDIQYSYRGDTRSKREILADALMSATKNVSERRNLESYQKIIGALDMQEKLKREKMRQMKEVESAAERDKIKKEIDAIDKKIAHNDKRLIQMEAAESLRQVIAREVKANSEHDIEYIKKRYEENKRKKQMTVLRNNIKNNSSSLITIMNKPTNARHVPEGLKAPLKVFLQSIDFISAYADPASFNTKQWIDRMNELSRVVTSDTKLDFDPDLITRMNEFIKNNHGKKLTDMDMAQLEELYIIVRSLRMGISNANRLFANKRNESADKLGYQTIEELKKHKDKKNHMRGIADIDKLLNTDMLDAASYFKMIGENGQSIYEELYDGWKQKVADIKKSGEYTESIYERLDISQKERDEWTGPKAKRHTFKVQGKEIELTTAQIMSLYEHGKREQSRKHMFTGGIKIDTIRTSAKDIEQVESVRISEGIINKITSVLTDKEKRFADALQSYLANECAKQGNETSMKLYGYRKFLDKDYFPIKANPYQTKEKSSGEKMTANDYAIINVGMTKPTQDEVKNGLVLKDIFDVFTEHVTDMANYHGLAAAIMDAIRWKNYGYITGDTQLYVKEQIARAFGKQYKDYFDNLMLDINNDTARRTASGIVDKFIGSYKVAAVGANLRVVVQQPTALIRAANMINPKYLVKAMKMKPKVKEAKANSSLAWWKSNGYYDTGIGQSLKSLITHQKSIKEKTVDVSMKLAGKADEVTWGTLWNAVKLEIADKTDLDVNSKEYMDKVTERFDSIIDETQVIDTVFSKSQFMKNDKGISKYISAFMAEPTKTFNMLRAALASKDAKAIGRAAATFITTTAVNAALVSVFDSIRGLAYDDEEKEKEFLKRYKDNWIKNFDDGANPIKLIPYVKDIWGAYEATTGSGISANRMEIAWAESIAKSCTEIYKYINGNSKKTGVEIAKLCAKAVSQTTGIPFSNAYRDIESLYNTAKYDILGVKTFDEQAKEAAQYRIDGDMNSYRNTVYALQAEGYTVDEIMKKVTSEMTKINKDKKEQEKKEKPAAGEPVGEEKKEYTSIYKAKDIVTVLADKDITEANNILNELYNEVLQEEPDKYEAFKKTRTKVKQTLSKVYKDMTESERKEYGKLLRQLKIEKIEIYTENDLKTIEKVLAEKNKEKNKK